MIRTTRPNGNNKYFIRKSSGGYSSCIQGYPTDSQCDVLANCVGYACGAFNEELDLGYEKYSLNCNAENFIERAQEYGLEIVDKPVVGSIICWEGLGDLAGHVAIVTEVINSNTIKTAESGYGASSPFWTATRYNNNGRWGMNSNYRLRGFIVNPNYPVNPPRVFAFKEGDRVIVNGPLFYTSEDDTPAGRANNVITTVTRVVDAPHPYNFEGDLGWCDEPSISKYEKPKPVEIVPGDIVRVNGTGNAASDGSSESWTRKFSNTQMKVILINKGAAYPYACNQYAAGEPGDPDAVSGWFAANDVSK